MNDSQVLHGIDPVIEHQRVPSGTHAQAKSVRRIVLILHIDFLPRAKKQQRFIVVFQDNPDIFRIIVGVIEL